VGEIVLEQGFWGLVKCGFLIGWSACIPSIADCRVGWVGFSLWQSDISAASCSPADGGRVVEVLVGCGGGSCWP
jgi:hypothetical protein